MINIFEKRIRLRVFAVIPFTFALNYNLIFAKNEPEVIHGPMLWQYFFGTQSSSDIKSIILSMDSTFVIILFCLLYEDYISSHFGRMSGAYFTRINDRKGWIRKKMVGIVWYAVFYLTIHIFVKLWLVCRWNIATGDIWQLIRHIAGIIIFLLPVLFFCGITVNWIALRAGSVIANISVYSIMIIGQMIARTMFDSPVNALLNPFCCNYEMLLNPIFLVMKTVLNIAYAGLICIAVISDITSMDIY